MNNLVLALGHQRLYQLRAVGLERAPAQAELPGLPEDDHAGPRQLPPPARQRPEEDLPHTRQGERDGLRRPQQVRPCEEAHPRPDIRLLSAREQGHCSGERESLGSPVLHFPFCVPRSLPTAIGRHPPAFPSCRSYVLLMYFLCCIYV